MPKGRTVTPQPPLMTTAAWCRFHGETTGKQSLASCLPASLPTRPGGRKMARSRKTRPIVLLPSLAVVSTVCLAVRVPLFSFRCTPDRPRRFDVLTDCFKIPSRQFSRFQSRAARLDDISPAGQITPRANKLGQVLKLNKRDVDLLPEILSGNTGRCTTGCGCARRLHR